MLGGGDGPGRAAAVRPANLVQEYVASTSLTWSDSSLLDGDVAEAVAELTRRPGQDIGIPGSGELVGR